MTFGQFLSILRARWLAALLAFLVVVGATLVISLLLPKQYKAIASVVVDFKPDPVSALYGASTSPGFMSTQVDIIQSDRVAQRVVRNLKLNENPQVRQQWQEETQGQGSIESWLGALFQKSMDVVPSRESSVIAVSYRAADPRFAAALANAFVQAYIDTALELRVDPARQYSSFFENRARESREALEKAQSRLSEFQSEKGIIATDERFDVESSRLNELSSQVTALGAVTAESASRQTQAVGGQGDRLAEVLNNGVISSIKADMTRLEARLQELSIRYGDNHPLVQETRANLAETRLRLDQEVKRVTAGVSISNTINRQREAEVRGALEAQRAKVLRMKAIRDEGLVLSRDVENAQRAYDAVQQRLTQTSLEGQTTQSNVNLLTQAVPPITPASPRIVLNMVLAALGGAVLACALALVLEMRDRRVRNIDDVVATLGLPVLVTLGKPRSGALLLKGGESAMQQRLLAPLPSASKAS